MINKKKTWFWGSLIVGWGLWLWARPAQAWRSALYPQSWQPGDHDSQGRIIHDFSYAGYHRGEKPIPRIEGPVFNIQDYGARPNDGQDDTEAIQAAIDAAEDAGGGVVYFPPGTYYVEPKIYGTQNGRYEGHPWALLIKKSGVVLRGAGPDRSRIFYNSTYSRKGGVIQIFAGVDGVRPNTWAEAQAFNLNYTQWSEPASEEVAITEDLLWPTKVIPVADTSPFQVGDQIMIQGKKGEALLNDLGNPPFGDNQIKGLMYQREIVAIDRQRKTITVDIPTRYRLRRSYPSVVYKIKPPIEEVGIEDLAFAMKEVPNMNDDHDIHGSHLLFFKNALNCWVRNVQTYPPPENTQGYGYRRNAPDELKYQLHSYGIVMRDSRNITIENVHLRNPQTHGEGGNGYMFVLYGNDLLVKDSSGINGRHNFSFKGMEANGVVLYRSKSGFSPNYPKSDEDVYGKTLQSDFHMWFSHANLIDNFILDGDSWLAQYRAWGNQRVAVGSTVFWNTEVIRPHIRGGKAIVSDQWEWGYVIGARGPAGQLVSVFGSANPGDPHRPDFYEPTTIIEGEGQGETLEPQSLYEDQLARRLGQPPEPQCAGQKDVNCDGQVDDQDRQAVLKAMLTRGSSENRFREDINSDGQVTSLDFAYFNQ